MNYTYDSLYQLTNEAITGDPIPANNGAIGYTYDPVGNRLSRASTLAAVPPATYAYDANDRLTSDTYDANGNTTASGGNTYTYDFENHLTRLNGGAVTIVYDGDGNRASKTVGGVTTRYLVDDRNPTGYAQVLEEIVGGAVQRTYTYGHDLISQNQLIGSVWTVSFYGYDGHGSVRFLTNASGTITDKYDYDAFGNLIYSTGATPNNYYYAGEQFDGNVGFYYLRARYYTQNSGRFLTVDSWKAEIYDPSSLHKYIFTKNNPVMLVDPSGQASSVLEVAFTSAIINVTVKVVALKLNYGEITNSMLLPKEKLFKEISIAAVSGFLGGLAGGVASSYAVGYAGGLFVKGLSTRLTGAVAGGIIGGISSGLTQLATEFLEYRFLNKEISFNSAGRILKATIVGIGSGGLIASITYPVNYTASYQVTSLYPPTWRQINFDSLAEQYEFATKFGKSVVNFAELVSAILTNDYE